MHRFFYRINTLLLILVCCFMIGLNGCNRIPIQPDKLPDTHTTVPTDHLEFIVLGDSGTGGRAQYRVANQLTRFYKTHPFSFVLHVGDIIYPHGNMKRDGYNKFYLPYKRLLDKHVLFYPALGNHDVDFGQTQQHLTYFNLPGRYYDFSYGNTRFFALDTNLFDPIQQTWLKKRLNDSSEKWKIVYGHHPVYSSGQHGVTPTLYRKLRPILEAYQIDLYLCGHDHHYERFSPVNNVIYVVSGGGGAVIRPPQRDHEHSLVDAAVHHFVYITIQENRLTLNAVDLNGNVIDTFERTKQ